jgi:hypothetical protein
MFCTEKTPRWIETTWLAAALALMAGCAAAPTGPSPQDGLPEAKIKGMHRVWDPMVTGLKGNCLQCHEAGLLESKGKLGRNTAWMEANRFRWLGNGSLPPTIKYEDMLALIRFMSSHYGAYHLSNEADVKKYDELLKNGTIIDFSFMTNK